MMNQVRMFRSTGPVEHDRYGEDSARSTRESTGFLSFDFSLLCTYVFLWLTLGLTLLG